MLDWSSVKIKRTVSSILEAEALSLKEALDNAIFIGSLLSEFISGDFKENKLKVEAFADNKPVEQSNRSTKQVHEERLRLDLGEVQRLLEEEEVQDVKSIPTELQLEDGLTKRDVLLTICWNLCQKTTSNKLKDFTT